MIYYMIKAHSHFWPFDFSHLKKFTVKLIPIENEIFILKLPAL